MKPAGVPVEAVALSRGLFIESIQSEGRLRSRDKRMMSAAADGYLERVNFRVGDTVKKGELLAVLRWDRDLKLTSPIDGVVSKVYREASGPVVRSEPILELLDPSNMEVVAEMLTTDATRVQSGARMTISGWGEKKTLDLKVTRVSRAGFTKTSALGVEEERTEVIAKIEGQHSDLLQRVGDNFHVDTEIEIGRQDNVLQVPLAALFRDGSEWAVYRVEKNKRSLRVAKAPITIGARNVSMAVVLSGLLDQDRVVIYPGDLLKDGSRVRLK